MRLKVFLSFFFVAIALAIFPPMKVNLAYVFLSQAYSGKYSMTTNLALIERALALSCSQLDNANCTLGLKPSSEELVILADQQLVPEVGLLTIVNRTIDIPIEQFSVAGIPASQQSLDTKGVLFGPGWFEKRIYFMVPMASCWAISVTARHDDPAPVLLDIQLDNQQVGTLSFDKGDGSTETLTLLTPIAPGVYWLRIVYVNDFFDRAAGKDRNAYVLSVVLAPEVMDSCAKR
ncbi:MAG: hypothetical protein KC546_14080 [Anaerolineae bacterium]|nr:hypothetical protein [Anaerolineae bacterium]